MLPGKPEDQNSYQGEIEGQLRVMCEIEIMDSKLGSTSIVVNSCENISALRRAPIQPEAVKLTWKKSDLISFLSDIYQSIDSRMLLVHIYGHHSSGKLASTLTPLSSLNVRLGALAEHIMASFLLLTATRNTIVVGFSDTNGLPSVSIPGV